MKVLYTTGHALWVAENGKATELPSYRELRYRETIRQLSESKAWKTSGRGAQFMGVAEVQPKPEDASVSFGGIAAEKDGFLYTITLDASSGIYRRNFSERCDPEGHIVSGNDFRPSAIAIRENDLAVVLHHPNGQAHIGLYHLPRAACTELTDGDSCELDPFWSVDGSRLLFSTCGIARGGVGDIIYGPSSAVVYHVHTQKMETLLEDDKTDFRAPKEDAAGNLYFIRQPYTQHTNEEEVSILDILKDVLLFPFRLVKAIFGFLNVFSIMFGREPLQSGGIGRDTKAKQKSEREMFLEDARMSIEISGKKGKITDGEDFYPASRVLVRKAPDGTEEILAKSVMDYCLCSDGVVYSTGSRILHRQNDGTVTEITKAKYAMRLQAVE
ncbi:MAG: hypothetical protein IJV58_08745 [Oscillospiraceae bacterium]|nr:hypothetical protein [Oscillospiraceae bacterium]